MVEVAEQISYHALKRHLVDMLNGIAKELTPKYKAELVVKKDEYNDDLGGWTHLFVAEKMPSTFLGIIPTSKYRRIVTVDENISYQVLKVWLADEKAKDVVTRHLKEYAEKYGISEIDLETNP
jgi:hypothetical protein